MVTSSSGDRLRLCDTSLVYQPFLVSMATQQPVFTGLLDDGQHCALVEAQLIVLHSYMVTQRLHEPGVGQSKISVNSHRGGGVYRKKVTKCLYNAGFTTMH